MNILCRLIAPNWLMDESPNTKRVLEGEFSKDEILKYNQIGYNIYYLPNSPSNYHRGIIVDGSHIDTFNYIFVDYDLKEQKYKSKDEFIEAVGTSGIAPTKVIDSGNGIHVYWRVSDLDVKSYLRLTRRMMRLLNTDEATCNIFQLMRLPGTINTKYKTNTSECVLLYESDKSYTCEELDKLLPLISAEDEIYCNQHYDKTYSINRTDINIDDKIPPKFGKLIKDNHEAKDIWSGSSADRSKDDFRLGHIMFANGFSKEEAASVLVNSAKALSRAPIHRVNYATNIIDKIWTFEESGVTENLSPTVRDILSKGSDTVKGVRFPCNKIIDDTVYGFRLGQVIGIVGGSGVGKTTLTLNAFLWFAEANPDYHHFFFSLEQPSEEIASRIRTICQGKEGLFDKIHIVSNYGSKDEFTNFSINSIEEHIKEFTKKTRFKVGTAVIDHIGVLAKSDKHGESEGLIGICKRMKAVAVNCNVMLIMLSQAPREKAGIGDIELNKDAAFGTVFFESFVDYCICMWQPLKRVYNNGAPTIMAFKFAKIRHKKQGLDKIQEDVCYQLYFNPETELLRELTQDEETSAKFYLHQAVHARKLDRKTDIIPYQSRRVNIE